VPDEKPVCAVTEDRRVPADGVWLELGRDCLCGDTVFSSLGLCATGGGKEVCNTDEDDLLLEFLSVEDRVMVIAVLKDMATKIALSLKSQSLKVADKTMMQRQKQQSNSDRQTLLTGRNSQTGSKRENRCKEYGV
jgi:hypothetical protein